MYKGLLAWKVDVFGTQWKAYVPKLFNTRLFGDLGYALHKIFHLS